jgi:hypothetical protein
MAVETRAEQAIEMEVVLNLAAIEPVGRQALEDATMEVQDVRRLTDVRRPISAM